MHHPHQTTTTAPAALDATVLIARMQPPHWGHVALVERALAASAGPLIVVLGSADAAPSPKNPWSAQQRQAMLRASLPSAHHERVHCVAVPDFYDLPRWCAAVENAVYTALQNLIHCAENAKIALVGHFKDNSSEYLRHFPRWQLLPQPRLGYFDATPIRDILLNPENNILNALYTLTPLLPAGVWQWLKNWTQQGDYENLREEYRVLIQHRAMWAGAPYPPTLVTVDAVVGCAGHVLLIQRKHAPGRGLWALPGGFLDVGEHLLQSCLRELAEETGLRLDPAATLRGVRVFDHPQRSQRGRTITHAHAFALPAQQPLPVVQGGDDAALAAWWPVQALAQSRSQLFDDHFHIVQTCWPLIENT